MQIFRPLEGMKEEITNHQNIQTTTQSKAMDTISKSIVCSASTFYNYLLSPHSIKVFFKPVQINLSPTALSDFWSILSICIVSITSSIATVLILSFKRSGNSGYSDSIDTGLIVLAVQTQTNDPYPYDSWVSELFFLMMDTMMFLSNPLVTTILLLCISIFVGHALCIQTTFIVPHPWKYLISIFFLFILGAAARLTTNCNNYMSSAKHFVLILAFKRTETLDLSNHAVLPDLSE